MFDGVIYHASRKINEADNLVRLQNPHIVRFYGLEQEGLKAFMLNDCDERVSLKQDIFTARIRLSRDYRLIVKTSPGSDTYNRVLVCSSAKGYL